MNVRSYFAIKVIIHGLSFKQKNHLLREKKTNHKALIVINFNKLHQKEATLTIFTDF